MTAIVPKNWNCGNWLGSHFASHHGHGHGGHGCLLKKVAVVLAVGATVHVGLRLIQKFKKNQRQKQYKRDTVILHTFPRSTNSPSMSPYCLKLETYLRVAKIPFEIDMVDSIGPNSKSPWITYNDDNIPDSTLCIEYLNKTLKVNLNAKLNSEQLAIAQALQVMAEEHLMWCFGMQRYVFDKNATYLKQIEFMKFLPNALKAPLVRSVVLKRAKSQGMGWHTQEAVINFARKDFKALSDILGEKKFFFGSDITETDCALFGVLAMLVFTKPGSPFEDWVDGEFKNLKNYCLRVKEQVWPDWEDHLLKPSA